MSHPQETAVDAYIRRLSELQATQTVTTQAELDAIALELGLTETDLSRARQALSPPRRRQLPILVVGLACGAILAGLEIGGVTDLQGRLAGALGQPAAPTETDLTAQPALDAPTVPTAQTVADFGDSLPAEADIPLQFEDATLGIEPRLSRLNNYDERSFYKLQAVLLNQGQTELVSLNLKVEYLGAAGQVILEDSAAVLRDSEAPLRPGDTQSVYLIKETPPNLAALRLTVTTRDQLPAPAAYDASPAVDYRWDLIPPANMDVAMTVRKDQFDQYPGSAYHDAVYAVTNTGEVAIQQLKVRMAFFNDRDTPIGENDVWVVSGDDAPLFPGETRPVRTLQPLPKDYARYTMTVIEAE
ncbi:MAG: hypothetical protein AAFZ80_07560 [Cyanobacteria bacterium P01_A01_bin.105]